MGQDSAIAWTDHTFNPWSLAGPLVAVGWGIQAAIIAQLAPMCRALNCAELDAIDREDRADCARTMELGGGSPVRRADLHEPVGRFVALYGQLARECAPLTPTFGEPGARMGARVLSSPDGGEEKTGADD